MSKEDRIFSIRKNFDNFFFYLLCFFPILLISGPFLSDLCLVLISIYFLISICFEKKFDYFKVNFFFYFFVFYLYLVINSIFVSGEFISFKSAIFFLRFGIFILAVSYILKKNINKTKYLLYSLLIALLFLSIDSFFQKIFGINLIGIEITHPIRISSFFGDEWVLGSFVIKILPLIIAMIFFFDFKNKIFFSFAIIVLSFFPILFSAEKAALALFILFLMLFFFIIPFNFAYKILLIISSIIFIVVVLLLNSKIKERVIDQAILNSGGGKFIFSRVHDSHFKTAYKMFVDRPIFGHGPKMFRIKCSNKKYEHDQFSCSTHPHNFYLQLLSETGVVGTFFLLLFYLSIIKNFLLEIKNFFYKEKINYYKYFSSCSILLFFLPISVSGNIFNNWLACIYSFSIALYYFFYKKF